MVTLWVMGK